MTPSYSSGLTVSIGLTVPPTNISATVTVAVTAFLLIVNVEVQVVPK